MEYLKVKTVLASDGQACKVEVLENLGQLEKDKWGNEKTAYNIKLNDKDLLRWEATENQVQKMKQCGENPFMMKRWDKDGKTGFNFFPIGDINVQPQNVQPALSHAEIERKVEAKQDDYQDKVSRGAAWNNAFAYVMKTWSEALLNGTQPSAIWEHITEVAEQIAPYQKAFVNGEAALCKTEVSPEPPPHTEEDAPPIDDLPF